jgi:hypothetical protein
MGTYTLTLKDGSTVNVEAPPNTPRDQLVRMAQMQMRADTPSENQDVYQRRQQRAEMLRQQREALGQRAPVEQDEESGFLGDILGGFVSGAVGVGEQAALGAATLMEEEGELAARDRIQSIAEAIRPDAGDPEDLTYKIASAFGSIAGVAGAGALAAYGGAAAGLGATGAGIAGLLGAGTLGVGAGAGEASERAREAGATQEERNIASRFGALIGSTEALPLGRVLGPIASRLVGDLGEEAVQTIGGRIARAARTGGEEAAQEAAANILQNLNERGYNAEQAILEGAGEAGAIGGVAGGALQLLVDTFLGRRARGAGGETPAPEEGPAGLPAPEGPAGLLEAPRRELPAPGTPAVVQVGPEGQARTSEQMRMEAERRRAEDARAEEQRLADLQDTRIPFSQQRTDEEYRLAQERAREREALRAAERGDEAAFEQPDLFALELEQDRRRLGEPQAAPAEVPTLERPREQGDLVDQIAEIEAADQQRAQAQAVRAESDLETIAGQQETQRMQTTERNRTAILQDVIENTPSRNYNQVRSAYEAALTEQGFKGPRAKATPAEVESIQRAVNVQRAERPVEEPVQEEPIIAPPEATQLEEMEARIPEATPREPEQLGMPGIRRRVQQAPVQEGTPQEAAPEPQPITKEVLDQMGIAPTARVRKRVIGRDLTDPATRRQLTTFANSSAASQSAQLGISRYLEGVPEAQPDLFTPRGVRRTQPAPAPRTEAADAVQPDTGRTRTGDEGGGRGVDQGGRAVRPAGGAGGTAAPRGRGLGGDLQRTDNIRDAASRQLAPLAVGQRRAPETVPETVPETGREGTRRNVMPTLEVGKKRTEALAPKPVEKKAATRTGATKASVEAKLMDAYDANTSADHKRFVKTMAVDPASDPMTVADKEAVLKLVNTKSSKELKNTVGAVKKYLGAYEDPILGLQDAVDDVVSEAPNFRKAEDMTAPEIAFFGPDTKAYLPARGKNSAQATLDWAAANMSEQTKKWIATAIRDAKQMNVNVAAFESTDLVAKRREIEAMLEGGFDLNTKADAQKLEALMEKLGIDESDPMLRSMLFKGGMFNMASPASTAPLPNVVTRLLKGGNLQGALRALAASTSDPDVRAVAEKLAKNVGDTKVKVVKSIDAMAGVVGRFTEADNTIQLAEFAGYKDGEQVGGLTVHTLLHEMTHAATVATLAKKNHPLTRKLQKIFDETKDHMPTAYGSTNVEEFVAEAFTNPEFQRMLSGLKVAGDPLTPFAKIKAAISNFLRTLIGKPVKPVESALEQTTGIIDNILAPAPNNIGTGEFYMLSPRDAGKRAADMLKDIVDSTKPATKEFAQEHADQVLDFVKGGAAAKAKQFLLYSLPMISVVNTAKKAGIKGADTLFDLMERQRGAMNTSDQQVEGVLKKVADWARANKDRVKTLDTIVYTSTIEQVDPSKPRSYYEKMNDPEKLKAYDAMRKDWGKLGKDGRRVYEQMRDSYRKQYEKMRDVIYGKLDDTKELSEESRDKLKKQVYARLFETGTIEPYFPLTRSGDYWLSYTAADGEFYVEAFQTRQARERAMLDLRKDPEVKNVEKFVNISNVNYARAPEGSFVKETLRTLDANGVDAQVKEEIMRLFIETLPETSFAKALQRRKGTKGYEEDAIDAFKTKAFDLGRQVERLRYSSKIREFEANLVEENKDVLTEENQYILDEISARAQFARNPPKDALAQNLNRGAFLFTLGFNVSSALVNTSQLPMVVYPMLAGKHGYGAAGKAISNATKLFASSGFNRKSDMIAPFGDERDIKVRAMPSIDNYFELDANGDYVIRKDIELDDTVRAQVEEIKPLMQLMAERGHLNRSLIADTLGLDASGRKRSPVDYVSSLGATFFHNAEVFNRQVTAMTAYQLELERLKTAEPSLSTAERQQKAAEQALYDSQMMNGGSVLETAPRISQQGIGRVAMMYKTYGIQMYYTLLKTARDGIDAHFAGDKEMRNMAAKQLAGVVGSTFVLAGVVGLPFAREIMQLIDLLFFDDEEDDVETVVRKAIGEGAYKGPLTAMLGVDLSSRIGLSGLILQANRFNSDPSPEESLLYYAGGPAWSTISSVIRGIDDMKQGEIERGFEAMMPSGLRNAYQAVFRFPRDEGILTRRGDPIVDDLSFGELAAKAIGFAPAEYTRTQEMNQQTKRIDRAVNAQRTRLLRQYYVALRMGDGDESRAVLERIGEFNRRHRSAAITPDSMRRSMRQHMETSATMYNGVTLSPNMRRVLSQSRDEWDQGWQLF